MPLLWLSLAFLSGVLLGERLGWTSTCGCCWPGWPRPGCSCALSWPACPCDPGCPGPRCACLPPPCRTRLSCWPFAWARRATARSSRPLRPVSSPGTTTAREEPCSRGCWSLRRTNATCTPISACRSANCARPASSFLPR